MDVLLNDDENLIVDSAREFLTGECPPKLVREMEADPLGYSKTLWTKVAELGWQGMCMPEKSRWIEYAAGVSGVGAA